MRDHDTGTDIGVTVSIGVASIHGSQGGADDLLRHADEALYAAKNKGRNRVIASEVGAAGAEPSVQAQASLNARSPASAGFSKAYRYAGAAPDGAAHSTRSVDHEARNRP